jgi:hypothetical protein
MLNEHNQDNKRAHTQNIPRTTINDLENKPQVTVIT